MQGKGGDEGEASRTVMQEELTQSRDAARGRIRGEGCGGGKTETSNEKTYWAEINS